MAMRRDNVFRASGTYSLVSARKKGLPPSGSTMGKSALRTRNRLFAASSIFGNFSLSVIYLDRCAIEAEYRIVLLLRKTGVLGGLSANLTLGLFQGCPSSARNGR